MIQGRSYVASLFRWQVALKAGRVRTRVRLTNHDSEANRRRRPGRDGFDLRGQAAGPGALGRHLFTGGVRGDHLNVGWRLLVAS